MTAESYAGSDYLSQSSPHFQFALRNGEQAQSLEVRWPDGQTSTRPVEKEENAVTVTIQKSK
jgi:hypothetical protein